MDIRFITLTFSLVCHAWALPLPNEQDRNLGIITETITIPVTTITEVVPWPTFTFFAPSNLPFTIADQTSSRSSDCTPSSTISPISPVVIASIVTEYSTLAPPTITEMVVPFTDSSLTPLVTAPSTRSVPSLPTPSTQTPSLATWAPPAEFSNLDYWNITTFADGKENIQLVRGIPASASATSSSPVTTISAVTPPWANDTSAIQLRYLKGSINPANSPQGGADFYATPLPEILSAKNASLEYSVFFPADFQWVKGGKLPGLYGGHYGCSGGDVADSCFSTRLMWRPNGMGELYLYVDKSKQPVNLCASTPFPSECNPQYGLSLSRGSFSFTPGSWTHLRQTVRLNTPGMQDGGFTLDANGVRVLTLEGIFYRGVKEDKSDSSPPPPLELKAGPPLPTPIQEMASPDTRWKSHTVPGAAPSRSVALPGGLVNGFLGGFLGSTPTGSPNEDVLGNLGGILRRSAPKDHPSPKASIRRYVASGETMLLSVPPGYTVLSSDDDAFENGQPRVLIGQATHDDTSALDDDIGIVPQLLEDTSTLVTTLPPSAWRSGSLPSVLTVIPSPIPFSPTDWDINCATRPSSSSCSAPVPTCSPYSNPSAASAVAPPPITKNYVTSKRDTSDPQPAFGFSGIFFSTFFGGHDRSWASPVDQYAWFKDFRLSVNA